MYNTEHQAIIQQLFDKVWQHACLGKRSTIPAVGEFAKHKFPYGYSCFRDGNGNKSLVGCLIPDDYYTPNMEGGMPGLSPGIHWGIEGLHYYYVRDFLLSVHEIERNYDTAEWLIELTSLAGAYSLVIPNS